MNERDLFAEPAQIDRRVVERCGGTDCVGGGARCVVDAPDACAPDKRDFGRGECTCESKRGRCGEAARVTRNRGGPVLRHRKERLAIQREVERKVPRATEARVWRLDLDACGKVRRSGARSFAVCDRHSARNAGVRDDRNARTRAVLRPRRPGEAVDDEEGGEKTYCVGPQPPSTALIVFTFNSGTRMLPGRALPSAPRFARAASAGSIAPACAAAFGEGVRPPTMLSLG